MNLPHLEPLLFAKEILSKSESEVVVRCEFEATPTLSMLAEASAQASSAFSEEVAIGFVSSFKSVVLLGTINDRTYNIKVTKEVELSNMKQFSFEVEEVATGSFTIVFKEESK
ncbi:MAG: hypothetical protein GQ570_11000 [Helicobacteraceae bacterium]|nr:hypothetical protein [Helicobacteraceae bacterium]